MTHKNEFPVYLIGNPNCGKTSLFNALTGQKLKVGNWPGVTIDRIEGSFRVEDSLFRLIDLPGTYSLNAYSAEEKIIPTILAEAGNGLILNILDCGNLERNLLLTQQLREIGIHPLLVLNCFDEMQHQQITMNHAEFERVVGCRAVPTVARTGEGIPELLTAIKTCSQAAYRRQPGFPEHLTAWLSLPAADALNDRFGEYFSLSPEKRHHFLTVLAQGQVIQDTVPPAPDAGHGVVNMASRMASDRFGTIGGILSASMTFPTGTPGSHSTLRDLLERAADNRYLGIPLLFGLLALIFWSTFFLGQIPSDGLSDLVEGTRSWFRLRAGTSLTAQLLIDGIIPGVGGILVFLPNVLILFLWIAVLEDSGYLARAAFLLDRFMQSLGLHGRAFIPILMGFGCNVPAILSTKVLEAPRQRLALIFLIPFVGCSARLPILTLFSGAFFPKSPGLMLFLMYALNFCLVGLTAFTISQLAPPGPDEGFLMEIPPYRRPNPRTTLHMLKEKSVHFLEKAGTVVLWGTVVIWFLSTFPQKVPLSRDFDRLILAARTETPGTGPTEAIEALTRQRDEEILSGKYLTRMGRLIHPLFQPLGFSWRETVSLFPGFLAKESIVSTLGVLYAGLDNDLGTALKKGGRTPLTAFVFMLFVLLYVPCLPTVGVIYQESRSILFTLAATFIPCIIAWITAFFVLQAGLLTGWH
jgi:ferrous iron transport protein B